ncbi:RNA polymerase sigma-70 factor (sigma-E family) [Stackebrandtia endophytica]|uniref:RNA polymerase sigma-70 factor (Sigma-E family) n=1 Tax=Stackebrandtia endophytica TaxID=1496996 RepID=A0A543ATU4_9ACTN|nr:SigE family RNA polymerase sigma factor [Stackebrandtia endophytica]TQL75989.1 RNA polymerase sigma-70 factor (sigma-E family) [Stackebrandtia endophytica]
MADFDDFVRGRGGALLRFAFLLCGDRHRAEDLVQEALMRCHHRWRRIERLAGPEAYVRKVILRQFLSWRRLRSSREIAADRIPDRRVDGEADTFAERSAIRDVLGSLPRRQRAVLVLRFYEDLPDGAIADLLGCSPATVRVHAGRALASLRRHPEFTASGVDHD